MSLLRFARQNARFLAFGAFAGFFSSFGQTYVIALYAEDIHLEFNLSDGEFGVVYGLATVASGTCLIWLGRLIDRIDLRHYVVAATLALAAACFLMAWAPTVIFVGLAVFTLRLSGQGLMSHIGQTSMARYFDRDRGKAISVAMIGAPLGAACFPSIIVFLSGLYGWRGSWTVFAGFVVVVVTPALLWLLLGQVQRHAAFVANLARPHDQSASAAPPRRHWTRGEVLRDTRFYLAVPAILAPSFIVTGFFFHQLHIVDELGWSRTWFASTYIAYGGVTIASSLIFGPLIDRLGAARLLPFNLVPLGLAMVLFAFSSDPLVSLGFMIASGITSGATFTILAALWAEVYGTRHLGAVRAFAASLSVFSTAASPALLGWLIDRGTTVPTIAIVCFAYIVVATACVVFAYRDVAAAHRRAAQPQPSQSR